MKDDRVYLIQILERIERIRTYTREGRGAFIADLRTQDAVIGSFEVIGEIVKRLSETVRAAAPEVPWSHVAGFRDILIHNYEGVDIEQVWLRVEQDLLPLERAVKTLLEALGNSEAKPS